MTKSTQELLRGALVELNNFCQLGGEYSLVHYQESHQAESGYIHYGYYLVYQGTDEEWQAGTPWRDHSGAGRFIGTNTAEVTRYIRQLVKERQQASTGLGEWWQNYNRSLERKRQKPRRSRMRSRQSGQSTQLPTAEEEAE